MNKTYKTWTKEQDDVLDALLAIGLPAKEIAYRLGRTRSSIYNRVATSNARVAASPAVKSKPRVWDRLHRLVFGK
jgi:DNA-binding NarL/FixJ family response regulator